MGIFQLIKDKRRIKKLEEIKKAQEIETERYRLHKENVNFYESTLKEFIIGVGKEMETEECHIKKGDRTILNKYSSNFEPNNGWDGGPNMLLGYISPEDKNSPIYAQIKDVYVDFSLAHDLIERYVNLLENYENKSPSIIIQRYKNYCSRRNPRYANRFGLYKTAMFKMEFVKFTPQWGLNVYSFLEESTKEAKETHKLWMKEISNDFALERIKKSLKKLEATKDEIKRKAQQL
jgi:hypothetical protein